MKVSNKAELQNAVQGKAGEIEVVGDLARSVHKARKARKIGGTALILAGLGALAAPLTGGVSGVAAASSVGAGGVALIIGVSVIGAGLLLAILKEYDEIEFNGGPPPVLILKRRKSK
jgi:hypothetical protein